jgi:hypothetical protein
MQRSNFHRTGGFMSDRGPKALRIVGMTFIGVAFAALFALVFGFVVKVLWNWLMPAIFGLGVITYWQAFGIVILAKLLFGAFAHHHRDPTDHFHRRFQDRREEYSAEIKDDEMMEGWKHYKQYWKEEGKAAFEDYLHRIKEREEKKSEA